ncbi:MULTISPECIES: GntR family transcriptional regulator [unclassified Corynebacterium]|uniref:GntR family transcriptional regulator n=1 Tax=unclassified Corynebacterium TaxID=2624378 RepID=UPI0029C9D9CD|nr:MULTISPECIES: GntR family transcriptional regulator [unclassified Corynebacterium]WPF66822.1 GntR family transcriptional regulator [Corynebacterium sp. 22KM0430]WPF69310.1 GntR family transcriptional regulator [Corynebacterium sp. 21KM1197]
MRAAQAASGLRRAISAGRYRPGDQLREIEMTQKLGISRNTLREAFTMLAAEGLVVREPNRGVFIASPTSADVRALYAARMIIEPAALRWGDRVSVDDLDAAVAEAEAAYRRHDLPLVAEANQRFHQEIVAGSGACLLTETMQQILAQMRLVFLSAERLEPDFHAQFIANNRAVVTALRGGDHASAAELLRDSLARTCGLVLGLIS